MDFDEFKLFLDENVRTWRDVEALCLHCNLDKDKFSYVQRHYELPRSVLRKFKDTIDWSGCMVEYDKFDDKFVDEMSDYVDWCGVVLFSRKVTEACLERHFDKVPVKVLSSKRILSTGFMEKFKERLNWNGITSNRIRKGLLDDEFLDKFADVVNWEDISKYGYLTTSQIEKHKDRIDWRAVSIWRGWTQEEMNRFFDLIDWEAIERIGNYSMSSSSIDRMKKKIVAVS